MATRGITIEFLGKDSSASKTARKVEKQFGKTGAVLDKVGQRAGRILKYGFGTGAVLLTHFGEKAATSNARIEQITESMGIFGDEAGTVSKRLEALAEAQARQTGVDQNTIKLTQAKLLTFKDLAKSADELGGNFDRATAAAVDLAAAGFGTADMNAAQLGKALQDPIKGLTSLTRSGVTFTDKQKAVIKKLVETGKAGKAQNLVLKAIETQVGGTAKATANSSDKMKVSLSQLAEHFGMMLLPAVDKVSDAVATLSAWMQEHSRLVGIVTVVLGGLLSVLYAISLAMRAWIAVQTILNAVLAANPIGLAVIAVAALVAGLVIAYKKSATFRKIVQGAMHGVAKAVDFVRDHWKIFATVLATLIGGPIVGALVLLVTHFGTVKKIAGAVAGWIKDKWDGVIGFFERLPSRITSATSGMWDGIKDAFKGSINWIIDKWNDLSFSLPEVDTHIPGVGKVGGWSLDTPNIPRLADGGVVTRPTLALVGEAGPEAVIPLSRSSRMGGDTININVSGAYDPDAVAAQIRTMLLRHKRTIGTNLGLA